MVLMRVKRDAEKGLGPSVGSSPVTGMFSGQKRAQGPRLQAPAWAAASATRFPVSAVSLSRDVLSGNAFLFLPCL